MRIDENLYKSIKNYRNLWNSIKINEKVSDAWNSTEMNIYENL